MCECVCVHWLAGAGSHVPDHRLGGGPHDHGLLELRIRVWLDALALGGRAQAVVGDDGRPLGLIERNAFTLRMAAEFGRALYARKPAESLMDRNAPIAEASTSAETFFQAYGAAELGALLGGFIVVADGRYLGVGTALQIVQAGAALHRASEAEEDSRQRERARRAGCGPRPATSSRGAETQLQFH